MYVYIYVCMCKSACIHINTCIITGLKLKSFRKQLSPHPFSLCPSLTIPPSQGYHRLSSLPFFAPMWVFLLFLRKPDLLSSPIIGLALALVCLATDSSPCPPNQWHITIAVGQMAVVKWLSLLLYIQYWSQLFILSSLQLRSVLADTTHAKLNCCLKCLQKDYTMIQH